WHGVGKPGTSSRGQVHQGLRRYRGKSSLLISHRENRQRDESVDRRVVRDADLGREGYTTKVETAPVLIRHERLVTRAQAEIEILFSVAAPETETRINHNLHKSGNRNPFGGIAERQQVVRIAWVVRVKTGVGHGEPGGSSGDDGLCHDVSCIGGG